ncbi:MAG: hypothetical protein ACRECQ_02075, partial [Burkholderiaceae bacterium]
MKTVACALLLLWAVSAAAQTAAPPPPPLPADSKARPSTKPRQQIILSPKDREAIDARELK